MTKVSLNGSLHYLTWKINIFTFDVRRESYCMFSLPSPAYEGNNNKDIEIVEYEGKLVMTCIDRENNFMEVWIMKDYNGRQWNKKHSINIWVLTRKEPYISHLAFYNADIILMGKYFPDVTFFNLKTRSIDQLRLGKGLLYRCFPFWFIFIIEEKIQSNTTLELPDL